MVDVFGATSTTEEVLSGINLRGHCTLPKAYCLHIFGSCDRICCYVLPPFAS